MGFHAGVGVGRYKILMRIVGDEVGSAASCYGLVLEMQNEVVIRIIPV